MRSLALSGTGVALVALLAGLGLDRVDVLLHSAGILHVGVLSETTNEDFTQGFAVNVSAVAAVTRELLPALSAARGRVLMINSGAGRHGSATARTPGCSVCTRATASGSTSVTTTDAPSSTR